MIRVAVLGFLLGAVSHKAGTGDLTTILAIASSTGVLSLFVGKILNRKQDSVGLSEKAMKMVKDSMDTVDEMRERLDNLTRKLRKVEYDLEQANDRVHDLEIKLETANGDRQRLAQELATASINRDKLGLEMARLRTRVTEMESLLRPED